MINRCSWSAFGAENDAVRPIRLSTPRIERGRRIVVDIDPGDAEDYFLQRRFWAKYDGIGVDIDLTSVLTGIAVIPALGTVIPVALATGVPVRVDSVDPTFAAALPDYVEAVSRMYPAFGALDLVAGADGLPDAESEESDAALLYSGGVDSAASLLRHRDRVRCLISVWGADVEIEDRGLWATLEPILSAAPAKAGTGRVVVRSNLRRVVDELTLDRDFARYFARTNWWGGIHHGIGLAALAAPVCAATGLPRLLIASSHSADFRAPWGSTPDLDDAIAWSGTRVRHDSFDWNRQEKLAHAVVPWLAAGHELSLSVCYKITRGATGINCAHCEKCMRTASGILALGHDPAQVGIPISKRSLADWRARMIHHDLTFGPNEVFMWQTVQSAITGDAVASGPEQYGQREYLDWLAAFDMDQLLGEGAAIAPAGGLTFAVRRVTRHLPFPVRKVLRKIAGS